MALHVIKPNIQTNAQEKYFRPASEVARGISIVGSDAPVFKNIEVVLRAWSLGFFWIAAARIPTSAQPSPQNRFGKGRFRNSSDLTLLHTPGYASSPSWCALPRSFGKRVGVRY